MNQPKNNVAPRLLVVWERRGQAFLDAIGPALSRSPQLLDGERGYTGVPGRAVFASSLLQAAFVMLAAALIPIVLPGLPSLTALPPDTRVYRLTYLPSVSPQVEDSSGAEEGRSGAKGGTTAYHPAQVIRVARGAAQVPTVYQPPKIALPQANSGFMNLLVVAATPVAPIPDVAHVRQRARVVVPAPVDIVPPPPRAESIAGTRIQLPLPEPVQPPATVDSTSARVPAISVAVAGPPQKTPTEAPVAMASLSQVPDAGFLISAIPGNIAAAPPYPLPGTLAMGPDERGTVGAGGSGGGLGTGTGTGPGSGAAGNGPGSGASGSGYGDDKVARGGTAAGSGPGGTGSGSSAAPIGVTIRGGPPAQPGVIYLSSFGGSAPPLSSNAQVPLGPRRKPAVTIVATPRSGGGLPAYGALAAARVYTTYLDTAKGPVVLQYADKVANNAGYDGDLTGPDPMNLALPQDLPIARVIVACTMDRNGVLHAFRVLEASDIHLASRIVAAIAEWRFRPVLRRDAPIEVSAILGFHVGTH